MRTLVRGIPYTILRATQFFEFLGQIIDAGAESHHVRLTTGLMQSSHLRIDARRDGQPWLADTASLAQSLIEAHERLAAPGVRPGGRVGVRGLSGDPAARTTRRRCSTPTEHSSPTPGGSPPGARTQTRSNYGALRAADHRRWAGRHSAEAAADSWMQCSCIPAPGITAGFVILCLLVFCACDEAPASGC